MIANIPYVIAAFSSGSLASTNIRVFKKARGDGKSMHVYFRPIDLLLSQKLIRSRGIQTTPQPSAASASTSAKSKPKPSTLAKRKSKPSTSAKCKSGVD